MGFSLYDFRDLDLMLQLQQIGDNDGWASTKELGEALGAGDDVRGVGSRASWMKRSACSTSMRRRACGVSPRVASG